MNGLMLVDALAEACVFSNGSPLARPDSGPTTTELFVGANSFAHGARLPWRARINPALQVTSPEPAGYP